MIKFLTLLDYIKHRIFGADTSQTNAKVCSLITKNPALAHTDWYRAPSFKIKHVQYLQNTTQTI